MKEGLISTIVFAYILGILARTADILFFYIIYKELAIDQVGLFAWAMALAAFVGFAIDFGANQVAVRMFSGTQGNDRELIAAMLIQRIIGGMLTLLTVYVTHIYFNYLAYEKFLLVLTIIGYQLLVSIEQIPLAWHRANQRQHFSNTFSAIECLGRMLSALILLNADGLMTNAVIGATEIKAIDLFNSIMLLHAVLCVGLYVNFVRKLMNNVSQQTSALLSHIFKILVAGSSFFMIGLCTVAQNRLDWLLLELYVNKAELASYSLANKLYEIILLFFGIGLSTIYPWLCKDQDTTSKERVELLVRLAVFFSAFACLLGIPAIPYILSGLFEGKYDSSVVAATLFVSMGAFSVLIGSIYIRYLAAGREAFVAKVAIAATILQTVVNFAMIPIAGLIGALIGMAVLVISTLILYMQDMLKWRPPLFFWYARLLCILTICLFISFAMILFSVNLIGTGVFALATLYVSYVITFSIEERHLMIKWTKNKLGSSNG